VRIAFVNQDRGIAPDRKKGAAVHLRAMREAFEALGAEVHAFDESDGETLRRRLREAWDDASFDFVYERYALGGTEGSAFASEKGVPFVLEVNAPLADEEERYRGGEKSESSTSERKPFEDAIGVICVSSEVADYAVQRGARPESVAVFPNGVDTRRFRPRTADDPLRGELVPAGRLALGFHGRLRPWHGFDRLVEVGSRLIERGVDLHFVLVGEGDFDSDLAGRIPESRVTRVGWIDHDVIPSYVATFDVLPLSYAPEAPCYFSPLKLAEAMACGVVPIVPRLGDLEDVVRHDENGLVYDARDLAGLEAGIAGLSEDPEKLRRLAAGALETASGLSWERIAGFVLERATARPGG